MKKIRGKNSDKREDVEARHDWNEFPAKINHRVSVESSFGPSPRERKRDEKTRRRGDEDETDAARRGVRNREDRAVIRKKKKGIGEKKSLRKEGRKEGRNSSLRREKGGKCATRGKGARLLVGERERGEHTPDVI